MQIYNKVLFVPNSGAKRHFPLQKNLLMVIYMIANL